MIHFSTNNPWLCNTLMQGVFFCAMLCFSPMSASDELEAHYLQQKQAIEAHKSINLLQQLVLRLKHAPEKEKLASINNFFNQNIRYADDIDLWKQSDYWATPFESIMKRAGDCEDFAIAKYMLLKLLNVPHHKLRLSYVSALTRSTNGIAKRKAHMVLAYYAFDDAEPLILDNIQKQLLPASLRPDLKLVYSFNHDNLWVGGSRSPKAKAQPSLSKWRGILARMYESYVHLNLST